jgi:hypothetical protein
MLKLNEYEEMGCLAGLTPSHRIANRINFMWANYFKQTYLNGLLLSRKANKNELLFQICLICAILDLFSVLWSILPTLPMLYKLKQVHGSRWARNCYLMDICDVTFNLILNRICGNLRKNVCGKIRKYASRQKMLIFLATKIFVCRSVYKKIIHLRTLNDKV